MDILVVLTVVDIVALIAGLAIYLFIVGTQLTRIAVNLEECAELVRQITANAEPIAGDVDHINRTGGVVAGALPLLYGMAEGIVTGATHQPEESAPEPEARLASDPVPMRNLPSSGRRRSRLHDGVGYAPDRAG